ncbi:MAG: SUMF1/EgtB/PvdO family nonheme iron enzyme [Deltaproteobacteria bacterium]|nr:SUMF1/EgtB/PvdO family nonheme iron enzyme [Deltaproteobacteria bacterium]
MSIIMGTELARVAASNFAAISRELVTIPGGTFIMGSPNFHDTLPHQVTVSSFGISQNPITNLQYQRFIVSLGDRRFALIGSHPETGAEKLVALASSMDEIESVVETSLDRLLCQDCAIINMGSGILQGALGMAHIPDHNPPTDFVHPLLPGNPPANFARPQQPAVTVDWYGAFVYASWYGMRLPREAETEYAARVVPGEKNLRDYATLSGELKRAEAHFAEAATIDVDDSRYPALLNGVRHFMGEVWIWQGDWYGAYPNGPVTDPIGPANGIGKVARGGSFYDTDPNFLRAVFRTSDSLDNRGPDVGFRVASSLVN